MLVSSVQVAAELAEREAGDRGDLLERGRGGEVAVEGAEHGPGADEALGLLGDDAGGDLGREDAGRAEGRDQPVHRGLAARAGEGVAGVPDARRQLERAAIEAGGAPEIGGGDAQLDELAGGAERAERPRAGDDVIELGLGEHVGVRAGDGRRAGDLEHAAQHDVEVDHPAGRLAARAVGGVVEQAIARYQVRAEAPLEEDGGLERGAAERAGARRGEHVTCTRGRRCTRSAASRTRCGAAPSRR